MLAFEQPSSKTSTSSPLAKIASLPYSFLSGLIYRHLKPSFTSALDEIAISESDYGVEKYMNYLFRHTIISKVTIVTFTLLLLIISGCQKPKSTEPKNPIVPKPDAIYVLTNEYISKVDDNSRWFNVFWGLVDKIARYDTGEVSIGWGPFGNYNDKVSRPPIQGLDEGRVLKPGEFVIRSSDDSGIEDELANTEIVLWYNHRARLYLDKVRVKELHEGFLSDMEGSGHAIEWSKTGTTYWTRMITLTPGLEKQQNPKGGYGLLLENSRPIEVKPGDDYKPRPYFSGWNGRSVNYNARNDFKQLIPQFKNEEIRR
jgi:hypothetical protein